MNLRCCNQKNKDDLKNLKEGADMKTNHAFTLLELLTVLAIASLVLLLGIPAFSNLMAKNIVQKEALALHKALSLARSSAVLNLSQVTVCPLLKEECTSDWDKEISLFYDKNKNRQLDSNEQIFYQLPPSNNESLNRTFNRSVPVVFSATGYAYQSAGSFQICLTGEATFGRTIILSPPGRIRRGKDKNRDGIDENSSGKNIQCN